MYESWNALLRCQLFSLLSHFVYLISLDIPKIWGVTVGLGRLVDNVNIHIDRSVKAHASWLPETRPRPVGGPGGPGHFF